MNKERYYIATRGTDDEAYQEAIDFAASLYNQMPDIRQVTLLISNKDQVGWFDRLLGPRIVKQLFSGFRLKEDSEALYKFETVKTYPRSRPPGFEIIIACGLYDDELALADDARSVKVIIAVPWTPETVRGWLERWNPIDLRSNTTSHVSLREPSCIVKVAMQELTQSINRSTGITHFADERLAKTFILALHQYGSALEAATVSSYLVRELGWSTEHAKDVEQLVHALNTGKQFKAVNTNLQFYYRQWQDACASGETM
ncbi:hypothetical protein [Fibrella aestuarina]|uniref:hypothetical protein n=1 Tax=Fibrella aestuarina TaxID=651143 RepID=UPI00059C85D0|nr:hypothetical protein [Fibrella aestuarina]